MIKPGYMLMYYRSDNLVLILSSPSMIRSFKVNPILVDVFIESEKNLPRYFFVKFKINLLSILSPKDNQECLFKSIQDIPDNTPAMTCIIVGPKN